MLSQFGKYNHFLHIVHSSSSSEELRLTEKQRKGINIVQYKHLIHQNNANLHDNSKFLSVRS